MQLHDFAQIILLGSTLQDKLIIPQDGLIDSTQRTALETIPRFPGRPALLARIGKAEFPKKHELLTDSARGRILHFFANHELLAMELMALMLLKFPEAPESFRLGIGRTILEEQEHLRLYLDRMRELGVDFGELPLSDYFWNHMKDMRSPLEFVIQMSLTLEQANLDYSLHYQKAVAEVGDAATAQILDRVYRDEIGHVRHGVTWFNRWRAAPEAPQDESDWQAYLRLLPRPMTPRRAKGIGFTTEGRLEAGLSQEFVRELEVFNGSKGRPPVIWIYNPWCDAEIARGKPGFTPPSTIASVSRDLEGLMGFLARDTDLIYVTERPRAEWLKRLSELGFEIPEFRETSAPLKETCIGGVEPWGWSPEVFEQFGLWREHLTEIEGANAKWSSRVLGYANFSETGLGKLFSKGWSAQFLRDWLIEHPEDQSIFGPESISGRVFRTWESLLEFLKTRAHEEFAIKALWGTSGNQVRRLRALSELEESLGQWARKLIENQGGIVVEPWLNKLCDLSINFEVLGGKTTQLLGIRRFLTGAQLQYKGTILGTLTHEGPQAVDADWIKFLHSGSPSPLERWQKLTRALAQELLASGYQGPAGIDAMLYRDPAGNLRLKPVVEVNPRWTMGRVALELESRVLPGTPAAWRFFSHKEIMTLGFANPAQFAHELSTAHPSVLTPAGAGTRLSSGFVSTNDPERARTTLTALVVGELALLDPRLAI